MVNAQHFGEKTSEVVDSPGRVPVNDVTSEVELDVAVWRGVLCDICKGCL